MNYAKIKKLEIIDALVISVVGTFLHFLFELSGKNKFVALFSPVNESTFEHLKLLFFSWLIFLIFELIVLCRSPITLRCYEYILPAKTIGVFCGMIAIIVSFYTYSGVLGFTVGIINVLTFFAGVAVQYFVTMKVYKGGHYAGLSNLIIGVLFILFMSVVFFVFTYNTPKISLFLDPVTKSYGI